jgi:hypothetical protein
MQPEPGDGIIDSTRKETMDTLETNVELAAANADMVSMLIRLNAIMRDGQLNGTSTQWCQSAIELLTLAGHDVDRAVRWNG